MKKVIISNSNKIAVNDLISKLNADVENHIYWILTLYKPENNRQSAIVEYNKALGKIEFVKQLVSFTPSIRGKLNDSISDIGDWG